MSDPDYDIAIVGGGLVGASLANLLAVSGWRVALIDANANTAKASQYHPDFDHRATAVSSGSADILERLGLWSRLRQHATPIRRVRVSDRGYLGGSCIDAEEEQLPALGYVVENAWLAPLLLEQARAQANVTCLAASVSALKPGRGQARLTLETAESKRSDKKNAEPTERSLTAALAVIADGAHSPLRQALGIETRHLDYHQSAIIANVSFGECHGSDAFERFTDEGPLALLPLDESSQGRRAALVWTLPRGRAESVCNLSDGDFLSALQTRFGWRLGRFKQVGKRQRWPLRLSTAREQIRSNLVLMGNAAHSLHPVAGQGYNLALRDCARLAEVLAQARFYDQAPGELAQLETYLARQKRDQMLTINLSDQLVRLFTSQAKAPTAARHLGLLGLDLFPALKTQFAAQTMGTAGSRARWMEGSV